MSVLQNAGCWKVGDPFSHKTEQLQKGYDTIKACKYSNYWEYAWVLTSTLLIAYHYGLNDKTKFMNKDFPVGKFFNVLPWYGDSFYEIRAF